MLYKNKGYHYPLKAKAPIMFIKNIDTCNVLNLTELTLEHVTTLLSLSVYHIILLQLFHLLLCHRH